MVLMRYIRISLNIRINTLHKDVKMTTIKERASTILSLDGFLNFPEPEKVKKVNLSCPHEEQNVLRMVVQIDGETLYLPDEMIWITPALEEALIYQKETIQVNHLFCYVTIRHGIVKSVTDDEWHLDGFSTRITHIPEQNYIWSDVHSTEFSLFNIKLPSSLDPLVHNMNWFLQDHLTCQSVHQCEEKTLYCLDPYVLHRRPKNTSGIKRTFVRISFVPIEINDVNNTQNPLIPRNYTKDGIKDFRNNLKRF